MQDIIPPPGGVKIRKGTQAPAEVPERRGAMSPEATDGVDSAADIIGQPGIDGASPATPEAQAIAEEFGGEAPTTSETGTESDTEVSPSGPAIGELGDTALDLVVEGPTEGLDEPIPDTALEHDLAEDVARAEKPRLDDIERADEAGKLTPENKELLEWLASEAAEKAMNDYIEGKSKMSEAEVLLREKASVFKKVHPYSDVETAVEYGAITTGRTTEEKVEILTDAGAMLDKVVELQLEQILGDKELSTQDRISRIEALKWTQSETIAALKDINKLNSAEQTVRNLSGHGNNEHISALWGNVIAATVGGYTHQAIGSIEMIADQTGVDAHDLIKAVLPEISKGASEHNLGVKDGTDSLMERRGYLWSSGQSGLPKGYVRVAFPEAA